MGKHETIGAVQVLRMDHIYIYIYIAILLRVLFVACDSKWVTVAFNSAF